MDFLNIHKKKLMILFAMIKSVNICIFKYYILKKLIKFKF